MSGPDVSESEESWIEPGCDDPAVDDQDRMEPPPDDCLEPPPDDWMEPPKDQPASKRWAQNRTGGERLVNRPEPPSKRQVGAENSKVFVHSDHDRFLADIACRQQDELDQACC